MTTTRRESTVRPPESNRLAQVFVDLFLRHPWAKVWSLILAGIVVYLIDRELLLDIKNESFAIVTQVTSNRNEIVLELPGEYQLVPEETGLPLTANVRIQAHEKDRARIVLPLRATIPLARLARLDDAPDHSGRISLEQNDVKIEGGVGTVTMQPVSLRILHLDTRELDLKASNVDNSREPRYEVTFKPTRAAVRGPYLELKNLASIDLPVRLPSEVGAVVTDPVAALPEKYAKRNIRLVEDHPPIEVTVISRSPPEELDVVNLPILPARRTNSPYVFKFDVPFDGDRMPRVTLVGTKHDVEECKKDIKVLESELVVIALVEKAIERDQALIDAATDPDGVTIDVRVFIPDVLLAKFKLQMRDSQLRVPIKVKRAGG